MKCTYFFSIINERHYTYRLNPGGWIRHNFRLKKMEITVPSDDAFSAAFHIKETLGRTLEQDSTTSINEWFSKPYFSNTKKVKYTTMANYADQEMETWLKLPSENINIYNDFDENLKEWLYSQSVEDLARLIDKTPRGCEGLVLTPWQRLYIMFLCKRPFSSTSSLSVNAEQLADLQKQYTGKKRKITIGSRYSINKNATQTINIVALATAGGKTLTCLIIANILVTWMFDDIVKQQKERCSGLVYHGSSSTNVARLVMVCGSGGVHYHWINEFKRILTEFKRMQPNINYVVWDGQSKHHSVENALKDENTVTFWFLQISKINEEMRKFPDIGVAVVITDEMTIDTPREKMKTHQSNVLVRLLPQATPQALKCATQGCTSWLREAFGGELISPKYLERLLQRNDFKTAQLCMDQYCKIMQYMPLGFRNQIRLDLQELIPKGMTVIHVPSKRGTLSSYLTNSEADIVPASFNNVLRSKLPLYNLDYENSGLKELNQTLENESSVSIKDIIKKLNTIKTKDGRKLVDNPEIKRMMERMEEFCEECPICCNETNDVKMMTCCSYCVCSNCHNRWDKCAFCRKPIQNHVGIPIPPDQVQEFLVQPELESTIAFHADKKNMQMKNLKIVLESLKRHNHKRILLMVDIFSLSGEGVTSFVSNISENLNMRVYDTEYATNGKGTGFKNIKEMFDDTEKYKEPMVLLCSNHAHSGVLVGVDLKHADSVVVVGDIPESIGTQLMGRVFRPLVGRKIDYIPFVKIYS